MRDSVGGSILGFLFALLSDPVKQRLAQRLDRKKLYASLDEVYSVAGVLASLLKTTKEPVLFPETRPEIEKVWDGLRQQHLEMLTILNFEMFSYYHDVARDRFYGLHEWSMLSHVFRTGVRMTQSKDWTEAVQIATDLRNDVDMAIEIGELSGEIFSKS
jgi:hypothetical protein